MQICAFCSPGYFFYKGNCHSTCPNGFFGHAETKTCLSSSNLSIVSPLNLFIIFQGCGSPTNYPQMPDRLADLPFPTVALSLSQGSNIVS